MPRVLFLVAWKNHLANQAIRQDIAAKGTLIQWHVAEQKTIGPMQRILDSNKIIGITIVHAPVSLKQ
jgi:hypothetical protein